jgi:polyhydroxyalkanoate synthase
LPIQPENGDRRFAHPAFTDQTIYHRVMCAEVDTAGAEAHRQWKDKEPLQSFANAVTSSSLAPTNVLVGNPAALERAFGSGGASLVLGLRNYLHLRARQAERLRVREDLAVTSDAVVYRDAVCETVQSVVAN